MKEKRDNRKETYFIFARQTRLKNMETCSIILLVFVLAKMILAADEMDNDAFIENFDEAGHAIACEWMGLTDGEELKLNLSRKMSYEDTAKLTFLNKGQQLDQTVLEFPAEIAWKREIVDQLYKIFKKACPNVFVKENYMNIMRELAMIYINSVWPKDTPDSEVWAKLLMSLVECSEKDFPPYNFTSRGLMIDRLVVNEFGSYGEPRDDDVVNMQNSNEDQTGNDESVFGLEVQMEVAETNFMLDTIIDNLWQVFSHAWARCLRTAPSKELWGPRFKQLFFRDFLAPLEYRWAHGDNVFDYLDLIVGDYDVARMQANIPYCTQAAYINPGGTHLLSQLVRPVKLTEIDKGVSKFQNSRA